jgi:hypothetical protein
MVFRAPASSKGSGSLATHSLARAFDRRGVELFERLARWGDASLIRLKFEYRTTALC